MLLVTGETQTTALRAIAFGLSGAKLRNVQVGYIFANTGSLLMRSRSTEIGMMIRYTQMVEGISNLVEIHKIRWWNMSRHIIPEDGRVCICESPILYSLYADNVSAEGPFSCANATIQNNDIGPCGSDYFQSVSGGGNQRCMCSSPVVGRWDQSELFA
jgi:hypothetical protein